MSKETRKETRHHMWDIVLSWFGLIREKHYDELNERYHRLYQRYRGLHIQVNTIVKRKRVNTIVKRKGASQ